MVETFRERLKKLKKNGNVIDVIYGDKGSEVIVDVTVALVKHDYVKFLNYKSGETFTISIGSIDYLQY